MRQKNALVQIIPLSTKQVKYLKGNYSAAKIKVRNQI